MASRLAALLLLAALAGCSSTHWKVVGNSAVQLAFDVLRSDAESDADAWVAAYQRCDALCESERNAASARVADEYERRLMRERQARTSEAFETFMNSLDAAEPAVLPEYADVPVVIVGRRFDDR